MDPVAYGGGKAFVAEDLGNLGRVDIVKEPQDVEEEEGPRSVDIVCGLYAVDEDRDGIDGHVVGPRPELRGG